MHSDKDINLQGQEEIMISVGEVDVGMEVEGMVEEDAEGEENKEDGRVRDKLRVLLCIIFRPSDFLSVSCI